MGDRVYDYHDGDRYFDGPLDERDLAGRPLEVRTSDRFGPGPTRPERAATDQVDRPCGLRFLASSSRDDAGNELICAVCELPERLGWVGPEVVEASA